MGLSEVTGGMTMSRTVYLINEDYKMLWDFSVRTDHTIEARRPDILIIDKSEKNCQIIDVVIPEDGKVRAWRMP